MASTIARHVRAWKAFRAGADECWLLQLVCLLQEHRLAEGAAILGDWLPAGTVRLAVGPAQVFAAGLAARGLSIPLRKAEAARRSVEIGVRAVCASGGPGARSSLGRRWRRAFDPDPLL